MVPIIAPGFEVGDLDIWIISKLFLDPFQQSVLEGSVLVKAKAEVTKKDPAKTKNHLSISINNV